jgi:DNA-binding transcriptional LysR family regulator
MTIDVLRHFLLLARLLHFTRAAEAAGIAQPALTRQIQQLEASLGVHLFTRTRRRVELTEAGHYFRDEVARLLTQLDHAITRVGQIERREAGDLRIGYTHSIMQTFLPMALRRMQQRFPAVRTVLREWTNAEQVAALEVRELEIGFCTNPVVPDSLRHTVLLRDPFVAVVPVDHPLSRKKLRSFAAFADDAFILPTRTDGSLYVATVESFCLDAGFVPRVVHETPFATTGLRLVEAGIGITIEPRSGMRHAPPGVRCIDLSALPQRAELTMVWHRDFERESPDVLGEFRTACVAFARNESGAKRAVSG